MASLSSNSNVTQMRRKPGEPPIGAPGAWVTTASGRSFDLSGQNESQVHIRDIAAALAKQCRFAGASTQFYSVAQHSCVVSEALKKEPPLVQLLGLLHDAHEAYTGDIVRPVKHLIAAVGAYKPLQDLEETVKRTIHRALRLPEKISREHQALIAAADDAALATELRDIMPEPDRDWRLLAQPLRIPFIPLAWARAEDRFLERFHDLSIAAGIGIGG